MQKINQYTKQSPIFLLSLNDIFVFENKVTRGKMQLDGQFALFPAAVECPVQISANYKKVFLKLFSFLLL